MATVTLNANLRETTGKRAARRLREEGKIPAVIYGRHEDTFTILLDSIEFKSSVHPEALEATLVNLQFPDDEIEERLSIMKEVQIDSLTGDVLHIDFQHVHEGEMIEVNVPTVLHGIPKGVKEGGVLEHVLRTLHIKCLPKNIPEHVTVEVEHMSIGDSFHVSEVTGLEVEILNPLDAVIATVVGATELVIEEELEEEAVLEEGEVPEGEEGEEGAPAEEEAGE